MKQLRRMPTSGFTLIELITVIVILGVLASAISTFIKFGTQIYSETTARDQLVSSARFAIERLNREVRNALPNSLRLTNTNGGRCLEFTPIIENTIYTDIPVIPEMPKEPVNTIDVIKFDEAFDANWNAVVYPLSSDDVYGNNGKVHSVVDINDHAVDSNQKVITLGDDDALFAENSPTQRLYFINGTVEYCLLNNTLTRNAILMAQNIHNLASPLDPPFEVLAATLQRNAMVQIHLRFEKHNEQVTFNNEVQVLNVP